MRFRSMTFLLSGLLLAACDGMPLEWAPAAPAARGEDIARDSVPATFRFAPPADASGVPCIASLRIVVTNPAMDPTWGEGKQLVAVWWAARADSTALLLSARGTLAFLAGDASHAAWERTVVIDSLDRGAHGCARPAPALAYEPVTRYVHASYAMDAPEGTGVFFAHSMDGGRMWHAPVSVVYGPRLARTAVAAYADTVAVAYEDPNTAVPQVALALSVTSGHIFEEKSIRVTDGVYAALAPAVAVGRGSVTVEWREQRPDGEVPMRRRATWAR